MSPFTAAFAPGARLRGEDGSVVHIEQHIVGALRLPTGRVCVGDPFTSDFTEAPFARRAPSGTFPVEVAVARFPNGDQRVACARVRFVAADAVRWELALFEGQEPPPPGSIVGYGVDAGTGCFHDAAVRGPLDEQTADRWLAAMEQNDVPTWSHHSGDQGDANVVMFSSGWGDGFYASYWGFDEGDALVELVTDFEVLLESVSTRIELPLPLPRGRLDHPLLREHEVTLTRPFFSSSTAIVGGTGAARVELSDGTPVKLEHRDGERHYTWRAASAGARLVLAVMTGVRPLERL